jgi:hypothetical protein
VDWGVGYWLCPSEAGGRLMEDRRKVMKGLLASGVVMAAGASVSAIVPPTEEAISRWINKWFDKYVTIGQSIKRKDDILIILNFDEVKFIADAKAAIEAGEMI